MEELKKYYISYEFESAEGLLKKGGKHIEAKNDSHAIAKLINLDEFQDFHPKKVNIQEIKNGN